MTIIAVFWISISFSFILGFILGTLAKGDERSCEYREMFIVRDIHFPLQDDSEVTIDDLFEGIRN